MKNRINIAIADDHALFVQGSVELLKKQQNIKILFTASNGKQLLDLLRQSGKTPPDVLLLDLEMPVMSGEETFDILQKDFPSVKIIIVSATYRPPIILKYMRKKVGSYLHKDSSRETLVETIEGVYKNGQHFAPELLTLVAEEAANPTIEEKVLEFSAIELSVLKLLAVGLTIKEIGTKLEIDPRSAEWHKSQMMRKLNTTNSNVLLVYAAKHNLV